MDVYKFDNVIYKGNSTLDFYIFLIKKNPKILKYLPIQIYSLLMYILGVFNVTELKEKIYCFLNGFKNIEILVQEFWEINKSKINSNYKNQLSKNDIIVTASPEFLVKYILKEYNLNNVIASKVDIKTGLYIGNDCSNEEIFNRLNSEFNNFNLANFYTGKISDKFLASKSIRSHLIVSDKVYNFNEYKISKIEKFKSIFFAREFIMFLIIGGVNTLNGILFAYIYALLFHANVAFAIGYISALFVSYVLNSYLTFNEKLSFKKYIKFCISYIPNFIIQNIVVLIVYNILGLNKLLAFALAAIIGIPVTFVLMKFFAFRNKAEIQEVGR
jgi:putative flippase GtrA